MLGDRPGNRLGVACHDAERPRPSAQRKRTRRPNRERIYAAPVAVQKAVELIGSGASVDEAVAEALDRAGLTLQGITGFEVARIAGDIEGARITYQVHLRVWFTLMEPVHG
jgi:flavin-binding protein dodecin